MAESRGVLLLLSLPLLLQVAVSLQTGFGGERTRRVPELPLPLLIIQVGAPRVRVHVLLHLPVLLVLLRRWPAEKRCSGVSSLQHVQQRLLRK